MSDALAPGWWRTPPAVGTALRAEKERGRLPFGALTGFTVVLMLSPQTLFPSLAPFRIALLLAGLAIAAQLWDAFSGTGRLGLGPEMAVALGMAAWAVAMVPLSYWPGGSLALLVDVFFKALAVFWLLGSVVTTEERLRRLCLVLVLCCVPLAASTLHNYSTGTFMNGAADTRVLGYDAPLTSNPNDLALVLNLVLPLGWALVPGSAGSLGRILLVGGLLLLAGGIVISFSRAGFLCLALTTTLGLLRMLRRGRWNGIALLVGIGLVALLVVPAGYVDRLATVFDIQSDPTGSAQDRYSDSLEAVRVVLDHPLVGAGPGMDVLALNEARGDAWRAVHNVYLEYAVDLGLPGLGLFALLFALCFADTLSVQRECAAKPRRDGLGELAHGIMLSLVVFGVAGFFHPIAYHFYFFYFAGLAVAARRVCDGAVRARA